MISNRVRLSNIIDILVRQENIYFLVKKVYVLDV